MAGSSFIFNFRKIPKAALSAVILILLMETAAAIALRSLRPDTKTGDLLIADFMLYRKSLSGVALDTPYDAKYEFKKYHSLKDMAAHGPYDVIVFGSSVGETGWVEMLKIDYGFKICKSVLSAGLDYPMSDIIPLISNYSKINKGIPAILLWVDLTERKTRNFKDLGNLAKDLREYKNKPVSLSRLLKTPLVKLAIFLGYKLENRYRPMVMAMNIGPREELFFVPDVEGLNSAVDFNPEEYSGLLRALKSYKEAADMKGCVLAMAAFPVKPQQYEWLINERAGPRRVSGRGNLKALERAARENNIPFLNLETELDKTARELYRQEGRLLWNRADSHMNQMGNRYTAEAIKSFIQEIAKSNFQK